MIMYQIVHDRYTHQFAIVKNGTLTLQPGQGNYGARGWGPYINKFKLELIMEQ